MVHHLKVDDFDEFKSLFDSDPVGRKQAAKGHLMLRSLDNPNEVFTRVEFDSLEDAQGVPRPSRRIRRARQDDRVDAADGRGVGREHHVLAAKACISPKRRPGPRPSAMRRRRARREFRCGG